MGRRDVAVVVGVVACSRGRVIAKFDAGMGVNRVGHVSVCDSMGRIGRRAGEE